MESPKFEVYKADSRGHANHGWLDAWHTFSFASYVDRSRVHFGVLRVLNDDTVAGGQGFGTHPHANMEIITIPLEGAIEHRDSMGNHGVIKAGEVQVMSAGTGVEHSEFNPSENEALKLFQIWLFPRQLGVKPRYQQMAFDAADRENKWQQILSPSPDDAGVWIHQDAWFYLGDFEAGSRTTQLLRRNGNGFFLMVIEGEVLVAGQQLHRRDGIGLWNVSQLELEAASDSKLLLMEVPMALPRIG